MAAMNEGCPFLLTFLQAGVVASASSSVIESIQVVSDNPNDVTPGSTRTVSSGLAQTQSVLACSYNAAANVCMSASDTMDDRLQDDASSEDRRTAPGSAAALDNPRGLDHGDVTVRVETGARLGASATAFDLHPSWEQFDEGNDLGVPNTFVSGVETRKDRAGGAETVRRTKGDVNPSQSVNSRGKSREATTQRESAPGDAHVLASQANGTEPSAKALRPVAVAASGSATRSGSALATPAQRKSAGEPAVKYDNRREEARVVYGSGVRGRVGQGGIIVTRQIPSDRERDLDRPLRAREMKVMKVLGVLAALLFFPVGIPAMYCAFRTQKEFDAGILHGNIDLALKYARRTQYLLIMTVVAAILLVVLVLALLERAKSNYTPEQNYVAHGRR